jgi:hypothetical protein
MGPGDDWQILDYWIIQIGLDYCELRFDCESWLQAQNRFMKPGFLRILRLKFPGSREAGSRQKALKIVK